MTESNQSGYAGQQGLTDDNHPYNRIHFAVWQILATLGTATVVQVAAVRGGGLDPVGFVDVRPMVNQIDGVGRTTPHGTIHNVPYFRLQGGKNAVVIDPEVGDIGVAVFASRDISAVKANKAPSNPGSGRQMDMADALYVGGVLNAAPEQYLIMNDVGITAYCPPGKTFRVDADVVEIHARATLKFDADGNGTVITSDTRKDYVVGSTNSSHPINPPEVP